MAQAALQDDTTQQDEAFDYPVEVEDAGPATKKVHVKIPRDRIDAYKERSMGEIRSDAALPGFRRGRAPRNLVEKRFGKALRDQVQQDLIRESYQQAIRKKELNPISDPEFDDPENVKLPDEGDFSYSFTIEVAPDFELPPIETVTLRKPKITIKDEHVQQALANLREQQGSLVPVEDRGVQEKDYLIADVEVKAGGETIAQQPDAQLIARPGRIAGIEIEKFADKVKGLKAGEEKTFKVKVPQTHPTESVRGKQASIKLKIKDIKALQLAEIDEPFLENLGFTSEQELLDALRQQMIERVDADIQNALRRQVQEYLIAKTHLVLPKRLSDRQVERVVNRRAVSLLMRGMPREQVQANVERLKEGAGAEAHRELTLFFVLQKVAQDRKIEVSDSEVNGQVAMLALDQGQRPESLRERMEKDGTLTNLRIQLQEHKALDALIAEAKIEEFEPSPEEEKEQVDAAASGESDEAEDAT